MHPGASDVEASLPCASCGTSLALAGHPASASGRCVVCRAPLGDGTGPWRYPAGHLDRADRVGTAPTLDETAATPQVPPRIGPYLARGLLGRGGMGVVYDAWDPRLDRAVAIKVLLGGGFASEAARRRLAQEAQAGARLQHPHVVRVFDIGDAEGQPYFAMERVQGCSLAELIASAGRLPDDEAVRLCLLLARAVQAAHDVGIAHRDLKPGNVLVDHAGEPRVLDFGIAKVLGVDALRSHTSHGLGTPAYMAPEVCIGRNPIDWVCVDVYGLGAILFACLTGEAPVPGQTPAQQLSALTAGRVRDLASLRRDLPGALSDIVAMALDPDPSRRYATPRSLAEDLERFAREEQTEARRLTRRARRLATTWGPRRGALATVLALAVAALTAPAAWEAWQRRASDEAREADALAAWQVLQSRVRDASTPAAAASELAAFADRTSVQGTAAAGLARIAQGDRLWQDADASVLRSPAYDDAVRAWSLALDTPGDPRVRGSAWLRLARHAWRRRQAPGFIAAMAEVGIPPGDVLEEDAVDARRWAQIAALLAADRDAARRAWQVAKDAGDPMRLADPERVGPLLSGGVALARELDALLQPVPGTPVIGLQRAGEVVHRRVVLDPSPHLEPAELPPREASAVWVDLDGDGTDEGHVRLGRVIQRVDHVDDRFMVSPAPPGVDLDRRTVGSLASSDLDGDGRRELLIADGEWEAYDLRVLQAGPEGSPTLVARATRNLVASMATVRDPSRPRDLLVTAEGDYYPNRRVFGPAHPRGPSSALVLWALDGGRLVAQDTWGGQDGTLARLVGEADVDQDGQTELVFELRTLPTPTLGVLWPTPDGARFEVSLVPGMRPLAVVGEPSAGRVLVAVPSPQDGQTEDLWVVGVGLPQADDRPRPRPDRALGADTRADEDDADRLVRLGYPTVAAALLEREALFQPPERARAMRSRAADIWTAAGALGEAARLWTAVADVRTSVPVPEVSDAWRRAVELWLDDAAPDRALDAVDAWAAAVGSVPLGALSADLTAWREARERRVVVSSDRPLPEALTVTRPTAVRSGAAGLLVHTGIQPDPVATFALELEEGPVAVFVDLEVLSDTWSSGLRIRLVGEGGTAQAMQARTGGGGFVDRTVRCGDTPGGGGPKLGGTQRQGQAILTAQVRLVRDPAGTWRCRLTLPEDHADLVVTGYGGPGPGVATLELLAGPGIEDGEPSALQTVRLDRLEVWGARWGPPSEHPHADGLRALAEGDLQRALTALPDEARVARGLALAESGRALDAIDAFRRAHEAGALIPLAPDLLRVHADLTTPLVQAAMQDAFPDAAWAAWALPLGDGGVPVGDLERLARALQGTTLGPDRPDSAWYVVGDVAEGLLAAGRTELGEAFAHRWLDAFGALPPDATPRPLRAQASALHRALRAVALARGDEALAARHAATSVDVAPDPLLAEDRLHRAEQVWP